ncbi:hypothetical protein [Bacillus marinisedimentorum]|uniref:hypothetical protein n=1 Tax=Bacillus marinisedimentorum TaxID=1821260 RepID=UPI0007DED746|nr:hypothetical protein [Bacillus marinisedimentorum]
MTIAAGDRSWTIEMRRPPAQRRTHKLGHPQEGDLSFWRESPLMTIAAGDRSWTIPFWLLIHNA